MKLILLLIILSSSASSSDQCIPNDEKTKICKQFVQDVMKPSIFEDSSASENEYPYRFVKDEKQAVKFLTSYDPTKLSISNQKCILEIERKTHADLEDVKGPLGCETEFKVLEFFRGLIRGMKLNEWSPQTISLGESVVQKHVDHVLSSEPSLLETQITFIIIKEAQAQGLIKDRYKNVEPFWMEADKISQNLQTLMKSWKKPWSRDQASMIYKKEQDSTAALIKKWKSSN